MRRLWLANVAVAAAVGVVIAGCGSSGSASSGASSQGAANSGSATSPSAGASPGTSLAAGSSPDTSQSAASASASSPASASSSGGQSASSPSGTSEPGTVDLGAGPVKIGNGPLKIAFFSAGSTNAYLQSFNKAAEDEAKKLGASLTIFDANFDPAQQTNQVEQVLANSRYNAWIMDPVPPGNCASIKQAVQKGILISAVNQPLCSKSGDGGASSWLEGTVNYVAGDQTEAIFTTWLEKIAADNPGPQKMLVLEGPPGQVQTTGTEAAIKKVEAKYPQMKITSVQVPGYALAAAQTKTAALIRSNPDLTIVAGNYSDLTQGAVGALQAAGKLKQVKVYDAGGDKWAVESVKNGSVQFTLPFLPATETRVAVQSLVNVWQGKGPGPHYVDVMDSLTIPGGPFISKSNVNQFTAQY